MDFCSATPQNEFFKPTLMQNLSYWSSCKQRIMPALAQNLNIAPLTSLILNSSGSNPYSVTSAFLFSLQFCGAITMVLLVSWPNPAFHARTKHVEIDFHFFQDKVTSKTLDVHCICSKDNFVDIFTKPVTSPRFSYMWNKLNTMCHMSRLRGCNEPAGQQNLTNPSSQGNIESPLNPT